MHLARLVQRKALFFTKKLMCLEIACIRLYVRNYTYTSQPFLKYVHLDKHVFNKKSGIRRFLFVHVITAREALVYKRDLRVDRSKLFQYAGQVLFNFI